MSDRTYDVETSLDVNLLTGQEIVRVRYREHGARRWTSFIVIPAEGQTVADLLARGQEIAAAHSRLDRQSVAPAGEPKKGPVT